MFRFLKKRAVWQKTARAMMAGAYLFVTFAIPITHTCGLIETRYGHHFDNPGSCSCTEIHTELQSGSAQDKYEPEILSGSGSCMACQYSIASKSTEVHAGGVLISTKVFACFQTLPARGLVKQVEWFTSIFLRAPPNINS